jgi:Fur family ferric uptake transcriptional regulator
MQGYKTKQKKRVEEFFILNRSRDFAVAEAAAALQGEVGKSSVYRIIAELETEGLLRRFFRAEKDCFVYQYFDCADCREHLHLKCAECGKVIHLTEQETSEINRIIGSHFAIINEQSTLFGLCSDCQKEEIK